MKDMFWKGAFARRAAAILLVAIGAGLALPAAAQQPAESDTSKQIRELDWKLAPDVGDVAGKGTVKLDNGMRFLGSAPTDRFMQLTGNLPRQNSFLLGSSDLSWFAVLDYIEDGYVKDDEKIDAPALLETLKEGNRASAKERQKRNLPSLTLEGWHIAPRYDQENRRLEWATQLTDGSGEKVVNYSTKVLGRRGYTSAILATDPANAEKDIREFKTALKGYDYVSGEKYSEWKPGEKVAAYGLGALIVGGAAAMATKKGFWAAAAGLLGAFWKVLLGVGVAAMAGIGSLFKKKDR